MKGDIEPSARRKRRQGSALGSLSSGTPLRSNSSTGTHHQVEKAAVFAEKCEKPPRRSWAARSPAHRPLPPACCSTGSTTRAAFSTSAARPPSPERRAGRRAADPGPVRASLERLVVLHRVGQPGDFERHTGRTRAGDGSQRRCRPQDHRPMAPPARRPRARPDLSPTEAPLCFPRSCRRAAGLRARHDCSPCRRHDLGRWCHRAREVPSETLTRGPATVRSGAMPDSFHGRQVCTTWMRENDTDAKGQPHQRS